MPQAASRCTATEPSPGRPKSSERRPASQPASKAPAARRSEAEARTSPLTGSRAVSDIASTTSSVCSDRACSYGYAPSFSRGTTHVHDAAVPQPQVSSYANFRVLAP